MKQFLFIFLGIIISHCAIAQGVTQNGQITSTSSLYVNKNGTIGGGTGVNKNGQILTIAIPVLTTTAITGITGVQAVSGGNVTSQGGAAVTARGVCWNTATNPTIALGTLTNNGSGTGTFASTITGLGPGTTYYVRAYATNAGGTAYGSVVSFTTTNLAVGDAYGGGIVFYILAPGDAGYSASVQHGLIRTPSRSYSGLSTTDFNTASALIQTDNTNNLFGYNDWRLPTISEAMEICGTGAIGSYNTILSSTPSTTISGDVFIPFEGANASSCTQSSETKNGGYDNVMLVRSF